MPAARLRAALPSPSRLIRSLPLLFLVAACGPVAPKLRYVSSIATQASWSFVVDDHARSAELLVDGRPRDCDRQGRQLRCELRGLFPGGHTVELQLAGFSLRRSVLVGKPWPERPLLTRVRTPDEAKAAGEAGADGVVIDPAQALGELEDIALKAHQHGARVLVVGDVQSIERAGADAIVAPAGTTLPADVRRRFPEARVYAVDAAASEGLQRAAEAGPLDGAPATSAQGLVEARGLVAAALALLAPKGAIVDEKAWPILRARKRHAALERGEQKPLVSETGRLLYAFRRGGDEVLLAVNGAAAPWPLTPPNLSAPIDLLGSHVENGQVSLGPKDVALIVNAPGADRTRF